jgi:hypothetical protein
MAQFTVTIARTLTLMTSVTVSAQNDEDAHNQVRTMIEASQFGTILWEVAESQATVEDWQEENDDLTIIVVEEAS